MKSVVFPTGPGFELFHPPTELVDLEKMKSFLRFLRLCGQLQSFDDPASTEGMPAPAGLIALKRPFVAFSGSLLVPGDAPRISELACDCGLPDSRLALFGLDVFACPFGVSDDGTIFRLDPESGAFEARWSSLDSWCDWLEVQGWIEGEVLTEWEAMNGPIGMAERLLPRVPFVLGGVADVDNLVAAPWALALEEYRWLRGQLQAYPEGTRVRLHGWSASYCPGVRLNGSIRG